MNYMCVFVAFCMLLVTSSVLQSKDKIISTILETIVCSFCVRSKEYNVSSRNRFENTKWTIYAQNLKPSGMLNLFTGRHCVKETNEIWFDVIFNTLCELKTIVLPTTKASACHFIQIYFKFSFNGCDLVTEQYAS